MATDLSLLCHPDPKGEAVSAVSFPSRKPGSAETARAVGDPAEEAASDLRGIMLAWERNAL